MTKHPKNSTNSQKSASIANHTLSLEEKIKEKDDGVDAKIQEKNDGEDASETDEQEKDFTDTKLNSSKEEEYL